LLFFVHPYLPFLVHCYFPLTIGFNDSTIEILNFRFLKESRKICNFKITNKNKHQLLLEFDILDENDGFLAEILYESKVENPNLIFSGNIIGVKSNDIRNDFKSEGSKLILATFLAIIGVCAYLLLGYRNFKNIKEIFTKSNPWFFVIMIVLFVITILLEIDSKRNFPKGLKFPWLEAKDIYQVEK